MAEPKPFYKIKAPSFTIELKPRCRPENEPLHCAHVKLDKNGDPRACRIDGFEDHYECAVCGALYCREHISEQEINVSQGTTLAICLDCSQLPRDIQMKIRAFRLELNS